MHRHHHPAQAVVFPTSPMKAPLMTETDKPAFDWENSVEAKLTRREEARQLERNEPVQKAKGFLKNLFRSKKPADDPYDE